MDIQFYHDIAAFRQRAVPLLKSQCAINSLKLGILDYYYHHPRETDTPIFAGGIQQDVVEAVFICSRSLYFFAQEAHFSESVHGVIKEFLARKIKIPGVMGYGNTALRFAAAWKQHTQTDFLFVGKDYLYELRRVGRTPTMRGALQRATSEDIPRLKPLFNAYYREDLGITKTDQDLEQSITEQLATYEIYFWNDNGIKSMVTAMLPFDTGIELANVFTPQAHRKKGYATACIAEVCTMLLERYSSIVLFVDPQNRAANVLYTSVGFHLVDEMNSYTLSQA